MLSKHNTKQYARRMELNKQRFSIKKLSVGVASVLVGLTFMGHYADADQVEQNADASSVNTKQTYSMPRQKQSSVAQAISLGKTSASSSSTQDESKDQSSNAQAESTSETSSSNNAKETSSKTSNVQKESETQSSQADKTQEADSKTGADNISVKAQADSKPEQNDSEHAKASVNKDYAASNSQADTNSKKQGETFGSINSGNANSSKVTEQEVSNVTVPSKNGEEEGGLWAYRAAYNNYTDYGLRDVPDGKVKIFDNGNHKFVAASQNVVFKFYDTTDSIQDKKLIDVATTHIFPFAVDESGKIIFDKNGNVAPSKGELSLIGTLSTLSENGFSLAYKSDADFNDVEVDSDVKDVTYNSLIQGKDIPANAVYEIDMKRTGSPRSTVKSMIPGIIVHVFENKVNKVYSNESIGPGQGAEVDENLNQFIHYGTYASDPIVYDVQGIVGEIQKKTGDYNLQVGFPGIHDVYDEDLYPYMVEVPSDYPTSSEEPVHVSSVNIHLSDSMPTSGSETKIEYFGHDSVQLLNEDGSTTLLYEPTQQIKFNYEYDVDTGEAIANKNSKNGSIYTSDEIDTSSAKNPYEYSVPKKAGYDLQVLQNDGSWKTVPGLTVKADDDKNSDEKLLSYLMSDNIDKESSDLKNKYITYTVRYVPNSTEINRKDYTRKINYLAQGTSDSVTTSNNQKVTIVSYKNDASVSIHFVDANNDGSDLDSTTYHGFEGMNLSKDINGAIQAYLEKNSGTSVNKISYNNQTYSYDSETGMISNSNLKYLAGIHDLTVYLNLPKKGIVVLFPTLSPTTHDGTTFYEVLNQDGNVVARDLTQEQALSKAGLTAVDSPSVTNYHLVDSNQKTIASMPITDTTPADTTVDVYYADDTQDVSNIDAGAKAVVTRTITITNPDGKKSTQTQSVTFTRTATKDLVTNKVIYGDWSEHGSHTFGAVDVPEVIGYTASCSVPRITVGPDSKDSTVDITYTANDGTQTIQYVDKDGKVVGTQIINGKTNETKSVTPDVPDGWKTDTDVPENVTIKPADTPIKVTVEHGQATVTADKPVKTGNLIPGTKNQHFADGMDADDLNHAVNRTIKIINPQTGKTKTIVQTVKFSRNATVDTVTGKAVSYTDWEPVGDKSFAKVDVSLPGYTPKTSVDEAVPSEGDKDSEIDVSYNPVFVTVTSDSPKTASDVMPDNPNKKYPAGVSYDDLNKTVTRTLIVNTPHQKPLKVVQSVLFTRTAKVNEGTGTVDSYSDWTVSGTKTFAAYTAPAAAGYDAPSVDEQTPDVSWKDSSETLNYTAEDQTTNINYVDEQGNRVHRDVVSGKTDQTVDVKSSVPAGWVIVSGMIPKTITFSGAATPDTNITIKHGTVTVTQDSPKTTGDVMPDNPNQHYPSGLSKDDLSRVITRTINVIGIDGKTSLLRMQSVKFTRDAMVDEVAGTVSYGKWASNGDAVFDEVSAPAITGYRTDKDAEQVTVNADMKDSTVTISYLAQPQTFNVLYEDEDGNLIKKMAENGKTGQKLDMLYQAPTGWVIENQAQLPTNVVLKGSDNQDVVVIIKHGSITVTPDSPKTSDDVLPDNPNLHYPSGLTKDDLSKTVTRVVKITDPHTHKVATTNQTVTFTRNAQVDEVSGTVSYDNWTENGEHDFDAVDVPTIAGYTPSTNNVSKITVTPDTESSEIDITYTANDGTQTIQYVDKDGNVIGTQIINGKTDEQKTVEADVPDGWTATTDIPSTVTIKPTDTPIKVTIGHGQANVDADHPVKPGDLIPGTKDKHYGKGLDTDDLNHTVTRVVKITDPHTKQTKTITQTVKFSRNATVDMVTGNVLSYTDWSPVGEDSFVAIDVPVVAGYTASGSVDKTTPQESDQDSEIDITYAPNVQTTHINYVDEQGEQIKQDTFNGKTDETVNINSRVPAGWTIVKGIVPKTITFAGTGTPDVSIIIKHQTVRISSNSPKTTDDVLPDNPNMHYPAGLTENDLSRTVSRVISITDPHTKKTATTLQTVTFLRTADVDEVTGKATYSPWTENGSHVFVAVDVPKVAGYTASGDAPQITITPDTKSSALDITYSADSHTTHIVYVDEQGNTVKTTTITGKTDQTVATNSTVPEGWVIKSGTIPMQISFTADEVPDTRITIAHGLVTVTPDNPKTQDDVLPNLPDKSYPAGVAEHDLNRVVTRTITLTDPNGKKTSKVQSVKFIRNATVDEVTGTVTYGKWSENGKHIFNATVATPIDGYTVKGSAPQVEVTPDSQDINVDLSYVANDQSTHIFFVDDSNKLIKSYTVTGKTGETVKTNAQVPTGWTIEKGTVPAEITFKGAHTADTTIVIKHGVVVVTPDNPKTTSDVLPDDSSKHFPAGLTKDDLSRTVTRSIEIINPYSGKSQQTQTVTFTRNAFFDEVTDKVTYGDWTENGSHKFDTILVPLVAGYHASGTVPEITVTPDIKSSNVVITYSANKVIQTVEYVDAQGNVVGKQIVDGLTDATVPFTPQVPTGWKLVNDAPKQFKLKAIDTPVKLNVVHNSITVTHDHPEPNGTLIPGTKDKYFGPGLDANDLNQTVTRTIEVIDPISKETKIHEQHVSFIRDANVDQVTGKVISYTDWKADGQDFFAEFVAPEIEGYTVSDKGKAEKLTPKADDPDTTVRLSYVPNKQLVKIIYSDANGKVIKTDIVNGVTDSTVDSGSFVPAGWVVSNGTIPERIHFVASSLPDIHVTVEHGKATVHSDDPKTTSDTLPDNYGQHYPEGVAKNDLSKTVTRTIIITNPDGSKTTKQQAVTFTRDAVVDEVNGQVAYGKWSEDGLHEFDEFFAPEIKGYTANGHAKRATVTPDSQNTVVEIAYAGDTHKAKILYVDPDGRLIHETDLQGTTDSTIQIPNEVPAEYHAVGDVPSTLKFGAEDHAAIVVSVAPNAKQVSQNKTLKREITVHLPNGKEETEIQTAVLTRLGTQDEVSKAVDWQPWSTSVFHVFVPDDIQGYVTPRVSAETVTGNSTNEQVDISYTPTRQTLVVEFVDQNGSVVKTELISGKTGETKRIDYDVDGYKLVSQDLPNTFTFNGQNKTMMVKVEPVQTETQSQQSTLDKNSAENTDNQADNQTDTDLDNNQRDNMGAKKETAKPEQKAKPTPKPKANKTNTPAQKGVQKTLPKAKAKSSVNAQKPSESVNHADEDIKQPVKNALLPQTSDNSSELGLMALGVISMLLSAGMIGAEWKKKVD